MKIATLVCLSFFLPGLIAFAGNSSPSSTKVEQSAKGKEVTHKGCLYEIDTVEKTRWGLVVLETLNGREENTSYELSGNTRAVEKYRHSPALSVRGVVLVSPKTDTSGGHLQGKLEVRHVEPFHPVAPLDKSITDASRWVRKTEPNYGVSLAAPNDATITVGKPPQVMSLQSEGTVADMNIGFATSNHREYKDGTVSIYVNSGRTDEETYQNRQKFDWINGYKYTRCVPVSGVRLDECNVNTFQNGLSYEFEFSFATGQPGMVDWGCLTPSINHNQEYSFARLFLSHVRFTKPEVPSADGPSISPATKSPQIVSFEKTPLVRTNAYSLSTTVTWKARDADYVQLSYTCDPKVQLEHGEVSQVAVEDASFNRSCEDTSLPDVVANRPPASSEDLRLYDQFQRDPVTIEITLTPYLHGNPFPQSAKTLSLEVPPPYLSLHN
jgi:hypothetical protein